MLGGLPYVCVTKKGLYDVLGYLVMSIWSDIPYYICVDTTVYRVLLLCDSMGGMSLGPVVMPCWWETLWVMEWHSHGSCWWETMDDGAYQEPLHLIINDGSYGGPGVTVLLNLSKIYQIHCFTHQIHCSPVKNMSKKCQVLAVPESVFSPYLTDEATSGVHPHPGVNKLRWGGGSTRPASRR